MTGCSCKRPSSLSGLGYLNRGAKCKELGTTVRTVCTKRGACLASKKRAVTICEKYGPQKKRAAAVGTKAKKSPLAKAAKACKGKKGTAFKSCVKKGIKAAKK